MGRFLGRFGLSHEFFSPTTIVKIEVRKNTDWKFHRAAPGTRILFQGAMMNSAPTHPAWFINLAKSPDKIWLEIGNRKAQGRGEVSEREGTGDALARIATVAPCYGGDRKETDPEIPIIRLTPA